MTPLDNFYLQQPEPNKSCLLALRNLILSMDNNLSPAWKYSMPFFCYKGKMFCYLWVHKRQDQPYIGIVEGARLKDPELVAEKRSRMKILLLDPNKDLPVKTLSALYKTHCSCTKVAWSVFKNLASCHYFLCGGIKHCLLAGMHGGIYHDAGNGVHITCCSILYQKK